VVKAGAIGGRPALEVGPYFPCRCPSIHRLERLHDVVAVEVMAAQAGVPLFAGDQIRMGNINGIFPQLGVLVALLAKAGLRQGDPLAPMFGVAGGALVGLQPFPRLAEAGLKETVDRMAVIGPLVAGQAFAVSHGKSAKIGAGFP